MVVKQYFSPTRITFSKGKQNLSKLFATLIYYLFLHNRQITISSVVQMVKFLIRKSFETGPKQSREISPVAEYLQL